MNKKEFNFTSREGRSKWLTKRFVDFFLKSKSVLDIGCWEKDLQKFLPKNKKYLGIDIAGNPDKIIDLDNISSLPFNDNEFDITVCADVLEHLENIHLIFDEILRVSNKYVLISLPVPAKIDTFRRFLLKKKYTNDPSKGKFFGKYSKYYGIPLEKPEDRHRWFFAYDEALDFVNYRAKKNNYSVKIIDNNLRYNGVGLNIFYKVLYFFKKELFISSIFFILEKKEVN